MANIVIFTGATGAGHTLAARSLKEALDAHGHQVIIVDGFKNSGKIVSKTVEKGYKDLVEYLPKLYRSLYNKLDRPTKTFDTIFLAAKKIMQRQLLPEIAKLNPDLIVSTHPIITNILGQLKEEGEFDYPILAFVTDFKIHETYINPTIDAYVVASDYTKKTMAGKGIDNNRIYPYGIPTRREFSSHEDLRDPAEFSILLMGGSLGAKQMKKTLKALLRADAPLRIFAVCGKNKSLQAELEEIVLEGIDDNKHVDVLGFVKNISELMDKSDIIITKPGGLTTSEAIMKNLPMIIPYTYPGQEEENANFLVHSGMALQLGSASELTSVIVFLMRNPYILEHMREEMKEQSEKNSIQKTVLLCEKLCNQHRLCHLSVDVSETAVVK